MHQQRKIIPQRRMDPDVAGLIVWWQTLQGARFAAEPARAPHEDEAVGIVLEALSFGHVVQGFLAFRADLVSSPRDPRFRMLTRQQFVHLQRLMTARKLGSPREELARKTGEVIGDLAVPRAFASFEFWGSAIPCAPRASLAAPLRMSRQQCFAADAIFAGLHENVMQRRVARQGEILEILEADQASRLPQIAKRLKSEAISGSTTDEAPLFDVLVSELDLAGTQQADLVVCCALLRHEVRKLHQVARGQFIRLLNQRQQRLLDAMEGAAAAGAGI